MAMQAPTPASAPAPVTPPPAANPPAPTAPAASPAPAEAPPAQSSSMTMTEVIAARRAALQGVGPTPPSAEPAQSPTPGAENQPPEPTQNINPPGQPPESTVPDPKTVLYEMMQNDPQRLVQILQVGLQPNAPESPAQQTPQRPTPEQYRQNLVEEAQTQYSERPRITAEGLFGAEAAKELDMQGADYTDTLTQFVYATMAPVLAQMLSSTYSLQHHFDQQFTQVRPLLQSQELTEAQREAGREMSAAFPALGQRDPAAIAYADKRFNELAPVLLPPELLNNPQQNPKEYARIMTSIAKIAAMEFLNLPPANTPAAQPTLPAPASVPPEPQPVPPVTRNHLGQYRAQNPTTLDEYNQRRLETIFPTR